VSIREIKKALFSMDPDKAPGPDGFTARFYVSCWDIIKRDLYRMIKKSQICSKLGGSTNSSFLALIPKDQGARNFNRFRPISLCNTGYKITTKIMANRLKQILPKLISENQGGFVRGRQILDNIIIVQEAIHTSYRNKEKGMVIKLDLASAFDRVQHDFLFAAMRNFGFNQNFIKWVKACISAPWIAPLINGRPTKFFQASRGLRQGCPLSPALFVIQASVLSYQLNKSLQNRALSGIRIAPKVKDVNHAQFADDTLLLGVANLRTARKFKSELDCFMNSSGSEINFHKSKIYGWNSTPLEMLNISRILDMEGISIWDTFNYLGIPIFKASPKVVHWLPLLDKLKNKIQAWGATWLNKAGKIVLINSVITSLPIYQCSVLLAPKTITNKIEEMLRRFLWEGGRNNEKKMHLVSWDKIKKPRLEGGLQIRDVATQNLAMGGKILWNMISGKNTWSKQILQKKYFTGNRNRCLEKPPKKQTGSPIFLLCKKALPYFTAKLTWIPGNGANINIWDDSILGNQPLNSLIELRNIQAWLAANNRCTLWDISTWGNDDQNSWASWNVGNHPEELQEEARLLLDMLQGKSPISARSKDKRGWGSGTGKFSASAGYSAILERPWAPPNPGPWKFI